jgi:hypothetical protein
MPASLSLIRPNDGSNTVYLTRLSNEQVFYEQVFYERYRSREGDRFGEL